MTSSPRNDRAAWWLLGSGLISACWLAFYPLPFLEFYKEWVFVVTLAMASLSLRPARNVPRLVAHPLVVGCLVILAALFMQAFREGLWPRAVLMALYVGFFVFAIAAGRQMKQAPDSLVYLSWSLLVAALGSCVFAALQLNWIGFELPLVAARPGNHRVTGNMAQSNHLADLLWLGSVAAAYLGARRRLGLGVMAAAMLTLQVFVQFSGSRMPWLYAAMVTLLAMAVIWRGRSAELRRMSAGLLLLATLFVTSAWAISASGALDLFGVESGAARIASGRASSGDHKRLWFWKTGVDAALSEPLTGVGVGRYVGHAHELTMRISESPRAGAEAHAHNLFLQLAAELGIPVAVLVAACVAAWLITALRRAISDVEALAVLTLSGLILVHANLEYPLWYAYFLGTLGLLAGHMPERATELPSASVAGRGLGTRFAAVAVLLVAAFAYIQFGHLAAAMQRVVTQVGVGAAPQRDAVLEKALADLPRWSPYRDYAESILLMTALPEKGNAAELAARCDRAVKWGPTPYLLSRCATAYQVAGQHVRASYFANSVCKIFPLSDLTLIQSMNYVGAKSPEAMEVASDCIERKK
jgi:O-antigen ligase